MAKLMKQMLSGICFCHANNVTHRDLRPSNILYVNNDDFDLIKIIDWGAARRFKSE